MLARLKLRQCPR